MSFGISVAPETFQTRVDETLSDLPGALVVHGDIILWGDSDEEEGEILMRCWGCCYRNV